jgi:hypothetical protein
MDSDSSSGSTACECGRDGGDGGTACCADCRHWHCDNKFCPGAQVIGTTDGDFCTDCLEDCVLIKVESAQFCQICGTKGWNFSGCQTFMIRGRTLCFNCLGDLVEQNVAEEEADDSASDSQCV